MSESQSIEHYSIWCFHGDVANIIRVHTCIPQACVAHLIKLHSLLPLRDDIIWGHCFHGFVYLAVLYYTGWSSQPYSYYLLVRENMYITHHHWSQNQSFLDVIISDASTFQAFYNALACCYMSRVCVCVSPDSTWVITGLKSKQI